MVYLLGSSCHPKAKQLGVIRVRFLPFAFTCKPQALVLTSKNAVLALEESKIPWHDIPAYVIGEGTKQAVYAQGGVVVYVAKSAYGDVFAQEIAPLLQGRRVAFPRAKEVVSDVTGILRSQGVEVEEIVAYETTCTPCRFLTPPPQESVLIFTSPSTVRCFFDCFAWDASWRAVCIGKKTAAVFPEGIVPHLSPEQTLDACVDYAHALYVDLSKSAL